MIERKRRVVARRCPASRVGGGRRVVTRGGDMSRYVDDYVELGVGAINEHSFKFGEFTGLRDEGVFLIGNANLRRRFGDGRDYLNASSTAGVLEQRAAHPALECRLLRAPRRHSGRLHELVVAQHEEPASRGDAGSALPETDHGSDGGRPRLAGLAVR
jgi:hypothetical protein